MKKLLAICLILSTIFLMTACGGAFGKGYRRALLLPTEGAVDTAPVDAYLLKQQASYKTLKEKYPNILSYLVNVTPAEISEECTIYKFVNESVLSLHGTTYLLLDGEVYGIGGTGLQGVKEIAYAEDMLYYIYAYGNDVRYPTIGAINLKTGERSYAQESKFDGHYITFAPSEDQKTLAIHLATVTLAGDGTPTIERGECLFSDIGEVKFYKSIA